MSRAIDDLRHEHEAVLYALDILERMTQRIGTVEAGDLSAFVGFLKEFADKCHHGKEEGFLFPALVRAGMPEQGGPVGVMLSEHVQGRQWIHAMEEATRPTTDAAQFTAAAAGYGQLMRAHIQKENNVLFPMAERMLPPPQLEEMFGAFERHEAQVIGEGRHEQLHALLERLHDRYAG